MRKVIQGTIERLPGFSRTGDSYFGLLVISIGYFFGIAPLDPDFLHDGVQYAAAAGVADGLHIQSQVFEQYGPTTAWLQGLTLKIFGANLLNLRIENAIFCTVIALVLLKILLLLRIPHLISVIVCASWVIASPVTSIPRISYGYAFWPWPSVITCLLLMMNSLLILKAFSLKRQVSKRENYALGALCAVMIFTRFQVGIIAAIVTSLLVAISWIPSTRRDQFVRVRGFFSSFGVVTIIFLSVLGLQGSLTAFIGQVITGSLNRYGNPFAWRFYKDYYIYGSIPFIVLIAISIIVWKRFTGLLRKVTFTVIALLFSFALYQGNVRMSWFTSQSHPVQFIFDQLPFSFIYGSTVIVGLIGVLAFLTSGTQQFRRFLNRPSRQTSPEPIFGDHLDEKPIKTNINGPFQEGQMRLYILLTIGLAPFAVQLYPMADQMHLWWISPYILLFFTVFLRDLIGKQGINVILASLLLPLVAASTISFLDFRSIPRVLLNNNTSAFVGMKVQLRYLDSYVAINGMLSSVAPRSAKFECPDGLFSSWTGHYLANDAKYVSWAWKTESEKDTSLPTRFFICASPADAKTFAIQRGYKLIQPGTNYRFGLYSSGTLFEYRVDSK